MNDVETIKKYIKNYNSLRNSVCRVMNIYRHEYDKIYIKDIVIVKEDMIMVSYDGISSAMPIPLSKFDRIPIAWLSTPSNELKDIVKHILEETK